LSQPSAAYSIGEPFLTLQTIESTNNYALQQIHEGLAHPGTAIFAREQTSGRGQRGKTWMATANENIILSIIVRPDGHFGSVAFPLSCCFAVATCLFFQKYAGEETSIKWPNDLYWRDRKAGGILVDSVLRTQEGPVIDWVVAGFGININQTSFREMERKPVSLRQISGKSHDPEKLAIEFCEQLDECFSNLMQRGMTAMLDRYNSLLYKRGQKVKVRQQNRIFELLIRGVNEAGELIAGENSEYSFRHGEIQWL